MAGAVLIVVDQHVLLPTSDPEGSHQLEKGSWRYSISDVAVSDHKKTLAEHGATINGVLAATLPSLIDI